MKKRKSIARQMLLLISCLTAGAILICILANSILLEPYYIQQKKVRMIETFEDISDVSGRGILNTPEYDVPFELICTNGNMKIMILTQDGTVVRSSANDMETMRTELFDLIFNVDPGLVVAEGDAYQLFKKTDNRLGGEYLILAGTLENGNLILVRTALESIHQSVNISNRFMLLVGLIAIGIAAVSCVLISRRITAPIIQLADISRKMVELDFDAKYVHDGWKKDPDLRPWNVLPFRKRLSSDGNQIIEGNEIDLLGSHINRLSENLEKTISELKSANLELTRDIEHKIQLDEMRKEFLSNVSHELKTPLAIIQGYAEGLQECINDDSESRDFYCSVIIDEADKMNHMVKKLLTLNQLEFGNDQVVMERFNLTELIRGLVNASQLLIRQVGITLDVSDLPDVYVWGDEFKVEEVLTNYLSNAIHYCEGEKQIRITYEHKDDILRVSLFNTGKPIPEEELENIWIKFYKVDKARTREYGGNGIGLSIVKAIMDSMGHACGAINHEDGVEFWFELSTK